MQLAKLVCRNAFRHRLRASLTILAIAVAVLAFGLLRTIVASWYAGVNASSASRLVTRNSISLVFSLPVSYTERIRSVPGVSGVSAGAWFGGIYVEPKNFIPNFAVQPKQYLELYPEYLLSPEEKKGFILDRTGCVVGRKTAQRFGWKVGDRITLKGTIYPGDWNMIVRGIYRGSDRTVDETQLFFHWDYLNETLRRTVPRRADQAGFYVIGVTEPQVAGEVAAR
ncbi:MAG TPA: ABC transporter permease, partial [Verrucomicrobiae bacterium]|nr:ABC transporter permease [Verrucomicrobiae bacterium]